MKRLLMIFGLLTSFVLSAEEVATVSQTEKNCVRSSNVYTSIGVGPLPILLPVFGVGYRASWNHHGFDTSAQVATIGKVTGLRWNLLYSFIVHPNPQGQTYVDLGAAAGTVFHHGLAGVFASPELVVGRQWMNKSGEKRFCQAEINFPSFTWKHDHKELCFGGKHHFERKDVSFFPIVTVSYGFLF